MNQYHAGLLALVISLAVSSAAFAQGRQMTPAERAQMQQEIQYQKQLKAKADQDAQTSYTQQCKMVAGQLACTSGPAKPQTQNKVVRDPSPQIGTAWQGDAPKTTTKVIRDTSSPQIGTAWQSDAAKTTTKLGAARDGHETGKRPRGGDRDLRGEASQNARRAADQRAMQQEIADQAKIKALQKPAVQNQTCTMVAGKLNCQ